MGFEGVDTVVEIRQLFGEGGLGRGRSGNHAVQGEAGKIGDVASSVVLVLGLKTFIFHLGEAEADRSYFAIRIRHIGELQGKVGQLQASGGEVCTYGNGHGAGAHAIGDGARPLAVDFDGDGALQEADGDDQAINFVGIGDDAFEADQRAALDVDLGSDAEMRPGLGGKAGTKDEADGLDFVEVDGGGDLADTDDADDAGGGQDGKAVRDVKAAKRIAGKEREIELLEAVRPAALGLIKREELFVAFTTQGDGSQAAEPGLDAKRVPGKLRRR
jgi:hypothetical protein